MKKYGSFAFIEGHVGSAVDGLVEFYFPLELSLLEFRAVKVDPKNIKNDKLKVIIVDRDSDDTHTDIMVPGLNDVFTVNDEIVIMRPIVTFFKTLVGKKMKLSEV